MTLITGGVSGWSGRERSTHHPTRKSSLVMSFITTHHQSPTDHVHHVRIPSVKPSVERMVQTLEVTPMQTLPSRHFFFNTLKKYTSERDETLAPGGQRRRLLKRDETLCASNCVVKFYTNRKVSWQGGKGGGNNKAR